MEGWSLNFWLKSIVDYDSFWELFLIHGSDCDHDQSIPIPLFLRSLPCITFFLPNFPTACPEPVPHIFEDLTSIFILCTVFILALSPQTIFLNFPYYHNDKSQHKPIWWHLVCYGRLFGVHKFSIESRLEFGLAWNNRMWRKWCSVNSWAWASRGFSASTHAT